MKRAYVIVAIVVALLSVLAAVTIPYFAQRPVIVTPAIDIEK